MQVLDHFDADTIRALHERGEFFWLDLDSPSDDQLDTLGELLEIPRLAIDDTKEFGQRPKIDDYGPRVLIVFYGAHDGQPVEVHVHVSGDEVVTVRRGPCAHLWDARQRAKGATMRTEQDVVYRVLDALSDSLRALVESYRAEVEQLEDVAFERPTSAERRRMSELRSKLFRLQQIVVPQRDMLANDGGLLETLPGLEREVARHPFRDVHDDLVLTANQIDYLRELLAEAVNVLLNQMAGRLTVVATVFLPLTFATGFFGMNFGWMVRHIDSAAEFLVLGIGSQLMTLVIAAALLRRAGYLVRR
ncbi:MAG TPA: magnesium transporter CorA family protein [Solirubrobacteraceae bacterium]